MISPEFTLSILVNPVKQMVKISHFVLIIVLVTYCCVGQKNNKYDGKFLENEISPWKNLMVKIRFKNPKFNIFYFN